nr:SpvB/TcaC N-terminal domain-containing protein [Amycolatopsis sp. WAC 01376]
MPDTFQLSGAEDLVPGGFRTDGDFEIQGYRPRTEGSFARIERWRQRGSHLAG